MGSGVFSQIGHRNTRDTDRKHALNVAHAESLVLGSALIWNPLTTIKMLQKYYSNGNCKCSSYFAVLLVVRTNSLLIERTILYQRNEMWRIEYITLLKFKSI